MHMQVPYGFPANFSKTVIVRYDHFQGTEDFREWAALLGKRSVLEGLVAERKPHGREDLAVLGGIGRIFLE